MFLSRRTKSYVLIIIAVLIFAYFSSGLADEPAVTPGPILIS